MDTQIFLDHFERLTDGPNAVARLREFVLQLAVQGRLVKQDERDEPAARLLERIEAERKRLVREKKIREAKPLPPVSDNEKLFEIPDSWRWVRLGQLTESMTNGIYKPDSFYSPEGVGCLRMYNIDQGKINLINLKRINITEEELHQYQLLPGDLLVNRVNSRELVGKAAVIENTKEPLIFESKNIRVRFLSNSTSPYYMNFLFRTKEVRSIFEGDAKQTTGQASINQPQVANIPVPLPPLEEQKRIVAKVDELMRLCDELERAQGERCEARQRLNRAALDGLLAARDAAEFQACWQTVSGHFPTLTAAPDQIDKLRQTVLQLAVQGKLTRQDPQDEPTSVLLEKVSKEKKRLIKEGKLSNKSPLPEIKDDEKVFELPESWSWVRLGDIVDQRLGKMLDKSKNKGNPYPYLRNTNVQWLRFDLSDVKEMRFEDSELEEYEVRVGDLLVCEGGEPGRCAIWGGQVEQIMFQKAIHRVRPFAGIQSWFLLYHLLANAMTGYLEKHFTGATIKHFTGQELAKYVIGLPPLEEQKRIVAAVNHLMALCDELEAGLRRAEEGGKRLLRAAVRSLLTPSPEKSAEETGELIVQ